MAETLYHRPDFPVLRQTYIRQNMDGLPQYPQLHTFLDFWEAEPERKPHEVRHPAAPLQVH